MLIFDWLVNLNVHHRGEPKSFSFSLIIHKFYIKSTVIQSYGFTNKFDFIIDLNRFVWIFLLKIQRLKSESKPQNL